MKTMRSCRPLAVGARKAGTTTRALLRFLEVRKRWEPYINAAAQSSEAQPDLPTVDDFVPGYEASTWYGVGIPKNTPADIIARLKTQR